MLRDFADGRSEENLGKKGGIFITEQQLARTMTSGVFQDSQMLVNDHKS